MAVSSRLPTLVGPSDVGDFAEDLLRLFRELEQKRPAGIGPVLGECSPNLDVRETDEGIEITVDLPGVEPSAVGVIVKNGAVLIAGEKAPRHWQQGARFHLVERAFGRFARTVQFTVACDAGRAQAVLRDGQLRVMIPRIKERRGRLITVPITT